MGLNPTTVPIREQKYVPSVIPYIHYITKIPWTSLPDLAKGREAEKEKFNRYCYAAAKERQEIHVRNVWSRMYAGPLVVGQVSKQTGRSVRVTQ